MTERLIFLDTETTGLDPKQGHRVIEFAALEMCQRRLSGKKLHVYCKPDRDIDEAAQRVHGISMDFLQQYGDFSSVSHEICDFLRGATVIAHNAPFDISFLNAEFARLGLPLVHELCCEVVDTLAMAKSMYPGKRNNLDALCDRLAVDRSNRQLHGALIDCALLAEVYLAMTRGQDGLGLEILNEDRHVLDTLPHDALSMNELVLCLATKEELNAHESYLDDLQSPLWYIERVEV
jgi:DNA polymerase-3 subunit epsilon